MTQHRYLINVTTGGFKRSPTSYVADVEAIYNGLVDPTKFTISYSPVTRIFSAVYASGAAVLVGGNLYEKSGTETLAAHANTSGKYYFYYNSSGNLVSATSTWDLTVTAPLLIIYFNATTVAYIPIDERHPALSGMDNMTHRYLHLSRGTQSISGFAISGYTLNTAGAAALSYAVALGVIADEDLFSNIASLPEGGPYRILYRSGSSGEWTWDDASTTGILDNGTNIQYNLNTGGTWSRSAIAANNTWTNYYVVALQEYTGTKQLMIIMGQATYASLALAQAEDPATSISGLDLLSDEFVYLYRMSYRRVAGSAPSNAQLAGVIGIRSNLVSVTGGFNPSDHSSLTNRDKADSHPASAISVIGVGVLSAATQSQQAFDILGLLPSNLWTPYNFDVGAGGQTQFSTPALTSADQKVEVSVNGVLYYEGATLGWQRDIVNNRVDFNALIKQYAHVQIHVYK